MRGRLATRGPSALAALMLSPLLLGGCALECSEHGGPAAICGERPEHPVDFQPLELTHLRVDNPTPEVGDRIVFSARAVHEPGFAEDAPRVFRWFFGDGSRPVNDRVEVLPDPARPGEFTSVTETRIEPRRCGRRDEQVCADQNREASLSLFLNSPIDSDRVERRLRVHTAADYRDSRPPIARFTAVRDPSVGTVVRFDATGSSDPDGHKIVAWHWDFGDGRELDQNYFDFQRFTPPADGTAAHRYPNETASYPVTLTVRDEVGRESEPVEQAVNVIPEGSPAARPPAIGSFTVTPNPAFVYQTVAFTAADTVDPDGDIDRYEWDLDGQDGFERTTPGPSTSMRYTSPREITVTVRVIDRTGRSDSASEHLSVIGEGPPSSYGVAGSSLRAYAQGAGRPGSRLPFEAELRGSGGARRLVRGRLYAWLPEPPRRLSWAERTFQRFLYAAWRARIKVRRERATGRVEISAIALARAKVLPRAGRSLRRRREPAVACLRLRLRLRPGARPAGRLTVLGGRGAAARLRGRARFRFVVTEEGIGSVRGTLRARRGPKQAAPRACRGLSV
jgi:PKD repeat protein